MELQFTSLNYFQNLQILEASTAEELRTLLVQIRAPADIVAIYAMQGKHTAWIKMDGKLIKKQKAPKIEPVKGLTNGSTT